jgi:hypothetical protein
VVGLSVLVVVPPVVVAEASCPTLTPATTIRATATSQAAVRRCAFFACLAIDPYLLITRDRLDRAGLQDETAARPISC